MNRTRGTRRGGRSVRAEVDRLARMVRRIQVSDQYRYPRGRFDPPRIVTNPRWNLVLDTTTIQNTAGTQTITNTNIRTAVRGQLGLPANYNTFDLYYIRVDLWSTPTDTLSGAATLAIRLCDLNSGSYNQWLEDQGTVARPGHVHAVWPVSQSAQPITSGEINILQIDSPGQFTGVLHVHLKISFTGGDVLPTVRRVIDSGFTPHPVVVPR